MRRSAGTTPWTPALALQACLLAWLVVWGVAAYAALSWSARQQQRRRPQHHHHGHHLDLDHDLDLDLDHDHHHQQQHQPQLDQPLERDDHHQQQHQPQLDQPLERDDHHGGHGHATHAEHVNAVNEAAWPRYWLTPYPPTYRDDVVPRPPMTTTTKTHAYVTFEDDAGGWNNMRMALECFVVVAKLTGRTLVMPPKARFYLLDTGHITTFDARKARHASKSGGVSGYDDYYDLDDLRRGGLDVISTEEFLARERDGLAAELLSKLAAQDVPGAAPPAHNGHHTPYFLALRELSSVRIWPSGPRSDDAFASRDPAKWREAGSVDGKPTPILHFPVHISKGMRYLSGAPALMSGASHEADAFARAFLRRRLHYRADIADAAQRAVRFIGGVGSFAAFHIRRNDLQYKHVFVEAGVSLKNAGDALRPGEVVYIATDETRPDFFRAFEEAGHKVVRFKDVAHVAMRMLGRPPPPPPSDSRDDDATDAEAGADAELESKVMGHVEQLICSGARVFFGTTMSTFSTYIVRLRRYAFDGFPHSGVDLECRFHDTSSHSCGAAFASSDAGFAPSRALF